MLNFAIRFGMLVVGLGALWMAAVSWRLGDPPTWTIFLPSDEALVLSSDVRHERISNGTTRFRPEVSVEWPAGSGEAVALGGIEPSFFAAHPDEADEIAGAYKPGETAPVRLYQGRVYADRIDVFRTGHAAFLTLFGAFLTLIGGLFAYALRGWPSR